MKKSEFVNLSKEERFELYEAYCQRKWKEFLVKSTEGLFLEEFISENLNELSDGFIRDYLED